MSGSLIVFGAEASSLDVNPGTKLGIGISYCMCSERHPQRTLFVATAEEIALECSFFFFLSDMENGWLGAGPRLINGRCGGQRISFRRIADENLPIAVARFATQVEGVLRWMKRGTWR